MVTEDVAVALGDFLAARLEREAVEVRGLRRLSGGASRETWELELFDALDGRREPLILQRVRAGVLSTTFSMEGEAQLLTAAKAGGVPVAEVVAASDDVEVIGAPFLVMRRVAGETIARRILRDDEFAHARVAMVAQCASALAAIHLTPVTAAPHLRGDDPVKQLRGLLDALGQPHPAFELGLRWLDEHRPPAREHVVVHGDFRLGNLMIDADGLAAVLDWELAHLGDPMEDLGWLCVRAWRFGSDLPVAGVGTYDAAVRRLCRGVRRGGRSGRRALVGGARHPPLGRDLHPAGVEPPHRRQPIGRAGRHRAPGVRERVRPARPRRGEARRRGCR